MTQQLNENFLKLTSGYMEIVTLSFLHLRCIDFMAVQIHCQTNNHLQYSVAKQKTNITLS